MRFGARATSPTNGTGLQGRLQVSANGRYLQNSAGAPFLVVGYVAWWAPILLSRANMVSLLDTLQALGVNAVIAQPADVWAGVVMNNVNGDAPFTGTVSGKSDFTTPNAVYWAEVDYFLQQAAVRGIVVFLSIAYYGFPASGEGFGDNGHLVANGTTRLQTYGTWLANRYATQSNIIWVNFNDNLPSSSDRALVKAMLDAMRAVAFPQVHTAHFQRPSLSTDNQEGTWFDLNWAYANGCGTGTRVHQKILDGWNVGAIPVFLGEDYYQHRAGVGAPDPTLQQQRSNTWETWLSGGCGKFLGDEYVWPFDKDIGSNTGQHWYDHLADTHVIEFKYAARFMRSRAWHQLQPSQGTGLVTSGGGTLNTDGYKSRALSSDGKLGLVYVTDGTSTTINQALMASSFTARWYDPTKDPLGAGAYTAISSGITNSGTQAYTTPGTNAGGGTDWILALETTPA